MTTRRLLLGLLAASLSSTSLAAIEVGSVTYSRGVLTGQLDGERPRLIAKGSQLHIGETLNTGSRGFALIELEDGTRMTLRPSTTFKIDDVSSGEGTESAVMSLIRGGLRALTGFISKRKPEAFRINTSVATIGIRGTEFDARLCAADECQQEEAATGETAQRESRVVGRVALLRGNVSARVDGEDSRILSVGAAVYERDQIQTGIQSFTVIAFNDQTRVTVSQQSAFRVEEHEYRPEQPDESNSFFSFLQGGLRIVTGAIARLNRRAVRVATPTATIGIRGTGFDLVCQDACVSENALRDPARDTLIGKLLDFFLRPAMAQTDGSGMYARVWDGTIELQLEDRIVPLPNGRTAFLRNSFAAPRLVPDIPAQLRTFDGAPRPDRVEFDETQFEEVAAAAIEPGLYVKVDNGDVSISGLDGRTLFAGAGEALRAGATRTERLGFVPAFQKFDPIPAPRQVTAQAEQMMNLFGARGAAQDSMVCTVR